LFILNLSTGALKNVSSSWSNVKDPMNAHWSPDGSKIVFMGRPKKGGKTSDWFDVFLYTPGQSGNPIDLTNTPTLHDEDPKFSPDGTKIVYKVRPSTLNEMDLNGRILNTIISTAGQERSMPYYTADARAVWFTADGGAQSSIHRIDVSGANEVLAIDTPGALDYYPIRDVVGQFLYTRWASPTNLHDQVFVFDGTAGVSLPFNSPDADYSDAVPAGAQYVVLSSTKSGGKGGYDLYLADRTNGSTWPLSSYNSGVNTNREELGASYTPN
jgi:Tol biopolymer transport system component